MRKSHERYVEVFGQAPQTHGAAGWQMNATAFQQIDDWGMAYASDGRDNTGAGPYRLSIEGRTLNHVQLPTTLATLDEVLGHDGTDEGNVAARLLTQTARSDRNQVYTLHAELEGGLLAPAFEALLDGWTAQGHQLVTMQRLHSHIELQSLPVRPLQWGSVPGRSGELIVA
jgi:peptidoglycan/xylan/chitin deacetylase (PgdA/CDA1 family)